MDLPAALVGFFIVVGFSSFVKIATSLGIVRFGLGLSGLGFGLVFTVLAFVLSLLVMEPHVKEMGGIQGLFTSHRSVNVVEWEQRFRPFLEKNTDKRIRDSIERVVAARKNSTAAPPEGQQAVSPMPGVHSVAPSSLIVLASFLISQLQEAFRLGLLFIVPFVILDLLTANILAALGMRDM